MDQFQLQIDEIKSLQSSPENRRRQERKPQAIFQVEDPIGWCKLFGFDANIYYTNPEFYFSRQLEQKLWRWKHFPEDNLSLTLEIPARICHYPEYTFVGLDVSFTSDGVPIIQKDHPLTKQPDLNLLKPIDFKTSGWMPRLLKWYDDLDKLSAGRMNVTLYAGTGIWWRGCLDLAIEMRGYDNFVTDTVERPEFLHDLLKWLVEQRCRWYEQYYQYFGLKKEPVFIGDDWVNVPFITPDMFADFVLPRYLEIEAFHKGINSVHSCGNQVPLQKYLLEIKSLTDMEVSPWSDLEQSLENIPSEKKLTVSIHANDVLMADEETMKSQLKKITQCCSGRDYRIMSSGLTPISDIHDQFIQKIRKWTQVAAEVLEPIQRNDY